MSINGTRLDCNVGGLFEVKPRTRFDQRAAHNFLSHQPCERMCPLHAHRSYAALPPQPVVPGFVAHHDYPTLILTVPMCRHAIIVHKEVISVSARSPRSKRITM
jgi:hypothetical protein